MFNRTIISIFLGLVFIVGAGLIVYNGRPVVKLQKAVENQPAIIGDATTNAVIEQVEKVPPVSDIENDGEYGENNQVGQVQASVVGQNVIPTSNAPLPIINTPAPSPRPVQTQPAPSSPSTGYTLSDVAKHNTVSDCWSVVNGAVYDLSSFVSRHPGGSGRIIGMCGNDASVGFNNQHSGSRSAQAALGLLKISNLR